MKAFDQVVTDVRIAKLGLDVSLELAKEAIPLGVQFKDAGEAGQRYDTWCRRRHKLLFAGHIGSGPGKRWSSEISGRAGDVVSLTLVVAALLMAITAIAATLVLVAITTLTTAALTALALVIVVMTIATALTVALALTLALIVVALALVIALALTLVVAVAVSMVLAALAMTISAALLALALSASSVMTTPAASLAWGVTIRPFGMVCWPHVFRPVV
jgi:hypothetical protein